MAAGSPEDVGEIQEDTVDLAAKQAWEPKKADGARSQGDGTKVEVSDSVAEDIASSSPTVENITSSFFGETFYIFISEYDFFTSLSWDRTSIFNITDYSNFSQYCFYDGYGNVDTDTIYDKSGQSLDFEPILTAQEMTVAIYYEWSVSDNGTVAYKCPDGSYPQSNAETGATMCTDESSGDLVDPELVYDTASTYQYKTFGDLDDPKFTSYTSAEYIFSLDYSVDEEAGLKQRFGAGDIESSLSAMEAFFVTAAETLYNTMNISRFNFKRTDSPMVKSTNLSAIGTTAVGSAFADSVAETGGL